MVNLLNFIKAFIVTFLISVSYTLYTTTADYQSQLAREGQEVGKIEALLHYSSLSDVWSRIFTDWLHLFVVCLFSCFLLLLWLKPGNR